MEPKALVGGRVFLEPLQAQHIAHYLQMFSPKVRALLRVKALSFERQYPEQKTSGDSFFYVIKEGTTGIVIGAIEIRAPIYRSQLYCWINECWWGAGYFQEAMQLAARAYFIQTNADTLSARVDCDNLRSYHALKKAGFTSDGMVDGPAGKQFSLVLKREYLRV